MEADAHQALERRHQEAPRLADAVETLLSRDEQGQLAIIRTIRKVMDEAVAIPGTPFKFGADSIIGLLPVVGDLSSAAIGTYILHAANKLGVPTIVMVRMVFNLAFDAALGIVPIIGDYLDMLFKANSRNVALVEQAVLNRDTTARSSWFRLGFVLLVFFLIVIAGMVGAVFVAKWAVTQMG